MKKTLLALALLAGATATTQAQSLSFGVKAGPTFSNLIGDGIENSKFKWGFHGGVMADVGFTDNLSFHPELLFNMKGHEIEEGADDGNLKLNYLDLPLLLRYNAGGLFFEAGPQVSFLLSGKAEDVDYTDEFNKTIVGYGVGLGYGLESGLSIGLRYNGDVSNVIKEGGFQVPGQQKIRNSAFMLSVGYSFGGDD